MKDSDLRWKLSSLLAGTSNHEFIDILFSAVPRRSLEEILLRKNSVLNQKAHNGHQI